MTPEELAKKMAEPREPDHETQRVQSIGQLYQEAVVSFIKDPRKYLLEFDMKIPESQKDAEDFARALAGPLLGIAIGLTTGIEPFLQEQTIASYTKRRKAKIAETLPKGVAFPDDIKSADEPYSQIDKCERCGHIYANHSNKDTGPCSDFRCTCIHFQTKGEGNDKG